MSETRKIAAILVADVVGYSRLAGADEQGIDRRSVRRLSRPAVLRGAGRSGMDQLKFRLECA